MDFSALRAPADDLDASGAARGLGVLSARSGGSGGTPPRSVKEAHGMYSFVASH